MAANMRNVVLNWRTLLAKWLLLIAMGSVVNANSLTYHLIPSDGWLLEFLLLFFNTISCSLILSLTSVHSSNIPLVVAITVHDTHTYVTFWLLDYYSLLNQLIYYKCIVHNHS